MHHPPAIVSVLPLRIQDDSRALKQVSTLGHSGYKSIVVEVGQSDLRGFAAPFKVISVQPLWQSAGSGSPSTAAPADDPDRTLVAAPSLKAELAMLADFGRFVLHLLLYIVRNFVLMIFKTPRASLYILHAPYAFPAVYVISKLYRAPYVYDAHDFYAEMVPVDMLSTYERNWRKRFYDGMERLCAKHASAVVTVSSGIADLMREAFGCQPVVIRNTHDSRIDRPIPQGIKETLGLGPDKMLIVVVGQAKQGRAIQQAIDALANLPQHVHMVFLGRDYDRYTRGLDSSLAARVHILPPVKPFEVVPFIRSADISLLLYYALTIDYEYALPNGLFQSIAAGLPVLYPGLHEISRLASEYQIGVPIDPRSPDSIRRGVAALLKDPVQLMAFRRNVQKAARELNWEQEEKLLLGLVRGFTEQAR